IRKKHPAFSPQASQKVLSGADDIFLLLRSSDEDNEQILVTGNVTGQSISLESDGFDEFLDSGKDLTDLVTGKKYEKGESITLEPYQVLWLK
ncbi:MAG: cyclomaltodextrinase C-terminal domain-containing protein, partial [Candidatus Halalkalibacterium sp. M3_1C_030]